MLGAALLLLGHLPRRTVTQTRGASWRVPSNADRVRAKVWRGVRRTRSPAEQSACEFRDLSSNASFPL